MKKINLTILTVLLAGCGIFEPVPESFCWTCGNTAGETPEPIVTTFRPERTQKAGPIAEPVGPVTEIVTTDMVKYVNTVTGETSYGPSYGGYLANHSDWEQVLGESM